MVVRRITWPQELIYTAGGQPVVYEQLSLPLFVTGYLVWMDMVKLGLNEIMLKHLQKLNRHDVMAYITTEVEKGCILWPYEDILFVP